MTKHIYIAQCADGAVVSPEQENIQCEVDIEHFLGMDQSELPTALAESVNLAVSLLNALERDLGASDGAATITPFVDSHGDLQTKLWLTKFQRAEEFGELTATDSILLTAYLDVAGFELPDTSGVSTTSSYVNVDNRQVHRIVVTKDNDESGDIVDRTQAVLLVDFDTLENPWVISLYGSYDIESDKFISADGEIELQPES